MIMIQNMFLNEEVVFVKIKYKPTNIKATVITDFINCDDECGYCVTTFEDFCPEEEMHEF